MDQELTIKVTELINGLKSFADIIVITHDEVLASNLDGRIVRLKEYDLKSL